MALEDLVSNWLQQEEGTHYDDDKQSILQGLDGAVIVIRRSRNIKSRARRQSREVTSIGSQSLIPLTIPMEPAPCRVNNGIGQLEVRWHFVSHRSRTRRFRGYWGDPRTIQIFSSHALKYVLEFRCSWLLNLIFSV